MDPFLNKNLITTKDAGELSGYSSDYLSRLVRSGKIVGKKIGHSWLIDKDSLTSFLEKQGTHKINRARSLADERAREYRAHRSLLHRATKTLTTPVRVPRALDIATAPIRSQVLALSVAALVVVSGALMAHASTIPRLASGTAAIVREVADGFVATFGDIPARIVARIATAEKEASLIPSRIALSNKISTAHIASPLLARPDMSLLHMEVPNMRRAVFAASVSTLSADAIVTIDDIRAFAVGTYGLIISPARAADVLAHAYAALGERAYSGVNWSFSAYDSFIEALGTKTLALAAVTRDILAASPKIVARIPLALGDSIIAATHAAIRVDVALAYIPAATAPKVSALALRSAREGARTTIAFIGGTGDALVGAAASAARIPSRIALALSALGDAGPSVARTVFSVEYAGAARFVAATDAVTGGYALILRALGTVGYESARNTRNIAGALGKSDFPRAAQDAYLGVLGKSALAFDTLAKTPILAPVVNASLTGLAAVATATRPALSAGEQVALATYEVIHGFINSTGNALAFLFGQTPPVTTSPPLPAPQYLTTNATTTPSTSLGTSRITTNSYPTYTTVVQGISQDFMNQSLASLRSEILATVSGMISPVSRQVVQNITTIQDVNRIEKLHDLIVINGDFRGGTFSSGVSVAATTGTFTTLTGGTTSLGNTTVTGNLTVSGTLTPGTVAAGTSISAPYFTATSTTATSTFAGPFALGGNATTTTDGTFTTNGRIGIGTTTPGYNLAVEGSSSLGNQAIAGYFTATTSTATSTFAGRLAVGTTTPWGDGIFTVGVSSPLLHISSNTGNVGIGTSTPATRFAVAGSGYLTEGLGVGAVNTAAGSILATATTTALNFVASNAGAAAAPAYTFAGDLSTGLWSPEASTLAFSTAGAERLRLDASGNVGIGTTTPAALLAVHGNSYVSGTSFFGGAITATSTFTSTATAANVFPYASTTALTVSGTNGLSLGTLHGPLQANAGLVSATTSVGVGYGGTGLTSVADGALLFGGAGGGITNLTALATTSGAGRFLSLDYTTGRPSWTATTSLGVAISDTTGTLAVARGGTGNTTFTASQLLYGNGTNALSSVATTTLAFSGPFSGSGWGALVGGENSTVTWTGLATTSQPSSSNLLVSNGGAGVYGVATSSPALGLGLAYSGTLGAFVGGAAGSLTVATSSLYSGTTGQFPYFSGTNTLTATSTLFLATSGNVGIGTTSPIAKLALAGGSFFQAGGDATSAFTASMVGGVDLGVQGNALFVSDRYAFVAANSASGNDLHIYDITDPTTPVSVGGADLGVAAQAVYAAGHYAYVGTAVNASGNELRIFDIARPAAPIELGGAEFGASTLGMVVSGRYLYVLTLVNASGSEFKIYDIANPKNPVEVGSAELGTSGTSIFVAGRYAYVTTSSVAGNDFRVFDVSNPTAPTLVGGADMSIAGAGVYVSGRYAYVVTAAVAGNDLKVFDVKDPTTPAEVGGVDLGIAANGIYVSGRYAYLTLSAVTGNEFKIFDLASSTAPIEIGGAEIGTNGNEVQVVGKYAYVVNSSIAGNEFRIYDITGAEVQSMLAHSLEAGNLQVRNDLSAQGQLTVSGGASFGQGGLMSQGPGQFLSFATSSLASVHALSAFAADSNTASVVDVFNIGHLASSTASNGIGTGLLFSAQNSSGTTTAIGRIASIFTAAGGSATTSALTFSTLSGYSLSEAMRLDSNGNVGIGTTTPSVKFSVGGAAGDATGHGYFTGGLGVGMVNTVAGTFQTSGAATFGGSLTVSGLCVTGDTRLRRRRKAQRGEEDEADEDGYIYDEIAIKDIQEGDEIQSLDEKTGKLVWSKVKQLAYMGKKQTYRLTTVSGKTIRTTANHPYLARKAKDKAPARVIAFIDLANIFKGAESEGWEMDYEKLRRYLTTRYGVSRAFVFGGTSNRPDRVELHERLVHLGYEVLLVPTRYFKDSPPKADVDSRMTFEMMRMEKEYDKAVVFTSDGDFYWVLEYLRTMKEHVWLFGVAARTARDLKRLFQSDFSNISDLRGLLAISTETQEAETTRISASRTTYPFDVYAVGVKKGYPHGDELSMKAVDNLVKHGEGSWLRVSQLKEGMEVAIAGNNGAGARAVWEKIISVEPIAEEDVYDVEIEGTHNFIGNDIVAHNTALFNQASTTLLSANQAYFGGTATSTFNSAGALTLAAPLAVTSGGTGWANIQAGAIPYGAGAGALATTTQGSGGQVLAWSGGIPSWVATTSIPLAGDVGGTLSATAIGANKVTLGMLATLAANSVIGNLTGSAATPTAVATSSLFTWTGTGDVVRATSPTLVTPALGTPSALVLTNATGLPVAGGGTGASTFTANGVLYGNTANAIQVTAQGGANSILVANSGAPSFTSSPTIGGDVTINGGLTVLGALSPGIASTTNLSANQAWFGATATSTFSSAGALTLITPLLVGSGGTGAATLTGLLQGNGTSAITGITGTAGQFPYYNGASTLLATSTIFLATSGNIGIGTSSPQSRLAVSGGLSVGADYNVAAPTNGAIIQGNVGIGTTGPVGKLDIQPGSIGFVNLGVTASSALNIEAGDGAATRLSQIGFGYIGTYIPGAIGFETMDGVGNTNGDLFFATRALTTDSAPIERMRITAAGNIGIGTTTPASLLQIGNPTSVGTVLTLAGSANSGEGPNLTLVRAGVIKGLIGIQAGIVSDTSANTAIYSNSNNVTLWGSGTLALTALSTGVNIPGNVGIGTAVPGSPLDVVANSSAENMRIRGRSADGIGQITFKSNDGATEYGFLQSRSNQVFLYAGASAPLILGAGNSEQVRITSTGNVGIGTTNPQVKLQVDSTTAGQPIVNIQKSDSGTANQAGGALYLTNLHAAATARDSGTVAGTLNWFFSQPTSGAAQESARISAIADGAQTGLYTATALTFQTFKLNDVLAERMRIDNQGNVGIGTTDPNAPLHLYNASNPYMKIEGGGSYSYLHLLNGSDGYLIKNASAGVGNGANAGALYTYVTTGYDFQHIVSGTPVFTIKSGGNVGIGTTSPDMLLSVGSATPVGRVAHFENSTGSCYINPTTTALECTSDARRKSNVNAISTTTALADIEALSPVFYNWNSEMAGAPQHAGFIAQQVQPIFPDLVSAAPDGFLTMNYAGLTPYLTAAIQALAAKIEPLAAVLSIVPGVESQCVTGDTKLRRRRRRSDGSFEFDEVDIKDIAVGDEIQSLDERTGQVVYSRVNALIDMGEQEVYELVTKSGRRIRTTSNHPFLARMASKSA